MKVAKLFVTCSLLTTLIAVASPSQAGFSDPNDGWVSQKHSAAMCKERIPSLNYARYTTAGFMYNTSKTSTADVTCPIAKLDGNGTGGQYSNLDDLTFDYKNTESVDITVIDNHPGFRNALDFQCWVYATDGLDANNNGMFDYSSTTMEFEWDYKEAGVRRYHGYMDWNKDNYISIRCLIPARATTAISGRSSYSYIAGYDYFANTY